MLFPCTFVVVGSTCKRTSRVTSTTGITVGKIDPYFHIPPNRSTVLCCTEYEVCDNIFFYACGCFSLAECGETGALQWVRSLMRKMRTKHGPQGVFITSNLIHVFELWSMGGMGESASNCMVLRSVAHFTSANAIRCNDEVPERENLKT